MKRTSWVLSLVLVLAIVGCEKLAELQNPDVRIAGGWQRIEMSFPGHEVYEFADRVITVDGFETGTYRFESGSKLEVEMGGDPEIFEVEFLDNGSRMIWYRTSPNGRNKASEWVRAE